jgi:hypothetical protein
MTKARGITKAAANKTLLHILPLHRLSLKLWRLHVVPPAKVEVLIRAYLDVMLNPSHSSLERLGCESGE